MNGATTWINVLALALVAGAVVAAGAWLRRRAPWRAAKALIDVVRVAAVTLAAAGIAAELVARPLIDVSTTLEGNHYEQYPPGQYGLRRNDRWEMAPLRGWHGFSVRTNEDGLRGDARRPDAATPADERRVLFLGDSWTFGLGLEEQDTFPMQAAAMLSADGRPWRALNGGVPGFNLLSAVDRFVYLAPKYRPQVVVFTVGEFDDALPDVNSRLRLRESPAARLLRRFALYRAALRWQSFRRYKRDLDAEAESVHLLEGTARAEQRAQVEAAAQTVVDLAGRLGCRVVFHLLAVQNSDQRRTEFLAPRSPLRAFRDRGIPFVTTLWPLDDPRLTIPHDGHPSEAGAAVLARTAVSGVRQVAP